MEPTTSPTINFVQGDTVSMAVNVTQSGSAVRTNSSNTLTGISTYWNSTMVGATLTFPDGFVTTITAVASDLSLTMASNAVTTDSVPVAYTNTVDITGWAIWFTVKNTLSPTSDSTSLIEATVTNHTNPTQGQSSILLSREATDVPNGTYFYDVRVTDEDDDIMSAYYGECVVWPAIGQRVS